MREERGAAGRGRSIATLLVAGLAAALVAGSASAAQGQGQGQNPPPQTPPTLAAARATLPTDPAAAAAMLETLAKADPNDLAVLRLLGQAHHQAKAYDAALTAWDRVLALAPDDPAALFNSAAAWARKGDADRAFALLRRAKATKRYDMTQVTASPDFQTLRGDDRWISILPTPDDFAHPFVEPVEIVAEFRGEAGNDQFGWIARVVGDVDADGALDFVTSAPTKALGGENAGRVYLYSSKTQKLLWKVDGEPGDHLGQGVEAAGDVNRDGVPDVVASAPGRQRVYVYSGRDGAVLHTFTTDRAEGFGRHVSGGDVDADGWSDVIVGAPGAAPAGPPAPGQRGPDPGRVVVYSGKDGHVLVEWTGERPGDQFGSAVSGDPLHGARLVVVGAPGAGPKQFGRAYVFDGPSKTPKYTVDADDTSRALGAMFVAVPGDVDGDGVPDTYVSDWANAAKGPSTGRVFVNSGKDGAPLFAWTGATVGEGFGTSASSAGDVDADGHADFIVGAWQHGSGAVSGGRAYLYSGADGRLMKTYTCRTPGDTFGFDAVGIGDVDADGVVDLLITSGWSGVSGFHSGRVFIISSGVSRRGASGSSR